jgi:hypothetical protein
LLGSYSGQGYEVAELYDLAGQQVVGGQTDPSWLTYAVVARSTTETAKWKPIRITLRRTDKTGHVLFKHPSTTLGQLQEAIQQLTNVAVVDQELLHRGYHLADTGATIEQIGFGQSSILHLIDLEMQPQDSNQPFLVNVQTAQSFSQTYQIEVTEGFSVQKLKERVSEVFEIPVENLLITYCGMILCHDETSLRDYKLVPGAYINAINEKKTFKPHSEAKPVEVQLRETTRVVPTTAQHEVLSASPSSSAPTNVKAETPSIPIPEIIAPAVTVPPVTTPPPTTVGGKENEKKAVTMSFSISSSTSKAASSAPRAANDWTGSTITNRQ